MSTTVTEVVTGEEITVFGAGDYFTKNGHLYFILDYMNGGFVIENCETLYSHPVGFEFMHPKATVKWIANDTAYRRSRLTRREVKC